MYKRLLSVLLCLLIIFQGYSAFALSARTSHTVSPESLFADTSISARVRAVMMLRRINRELEEGGSIEQLFTAKLNHWKSQTERFKGFDPQLSKSEDEIWIHVPSSNISVRYYYSGAEKSRTFLPGMDSLTAETFVVSDTINCQIVRHLKADEDEIIAKAKEFAKNIVDEFLVPEQTSIAKESIAPDQHTTTDVEAHKKLSDMIKKNFPGHNILGEEEKFDRSKWLEGARYVWLLDPLCGTKDFYSGAKSFGTSIMCIDMVTMEPVVTVCYGYRCRRDSSTSGGEENKFLACATREGTFINGRKTFIGHEGIGNRKAFVSKHRSVKMPGAADDAAVPDPLSAYRDALGDDIESIDGSMNFFDLVDGFLITGDMGLFLGMFNSHDCFPRAHILQQAGVNVSYLDGSPVFSVMGLNLLKWQDRLPPILYSMPEVHDAYIGRFSEVKQPEIVEVFANRTGVGIMETDKEDSEKIKAAKEYIEKCKQNITVTLASSANDVLFSFPIELLEELSGILGDEFVKDFLKYIYNSPRGNIELYYTSGVDSVKLDEISGVPETVYKKFGLSKESLRELFRDERFTKTRENTITLLPLSQGESVDMDVVKQMISTLDISLDETILVPVGFHNDPTGLLRGTFFGLQMMELARLSDGGRNADDALAQKITGNLKQLLISLGVPAGDVDELDKSDIINIATSNPNNIVRALKKLVNLLPVIPMDVSELRKTYDFAVQVITAA